MTDEPLLHNQRTTCRLLGVSRQAFAAWNVAPDEIRGTEKLYEWTRVQKIAARKMAARPSNVVHLVPDPSALPPGFDPTTLPGAGNLLRLVAWIYHTELREQRARFWQNYLAVGNDAGERFWDSMRIPKKRHAELVDRIIQLETLQAEVFLRDCFDDRFQELAGMTLDQLFDELTGNRLQLGKTTWPPE